MEDIATGVWPFMIARPIVLFVLVLFPEWVKVPAKWLAGHKRYIKRKRGEPRWPPRS
jgi:hypothetical protein